jgi:3-dehydroquinate dehydratase-1
MKQTLVVNKNRLKCEKGIFRPGAVVGTVHTPAGLRSAARLRVGEAVDALDAVEIRLDAVRPTEAQLQKIVLPIILTPRCGSEGGARDWDAGQRTRETLEHLSLAAAVDVELAQQGKMKHLLRECRANNIPVIFSFHDFEGTPGLAVLRRLHARAGDAGAAVFKVATRLRKPSDLGTLLALVEVGAAGAVPVAAMGMGSLGRASRIVLGLAGSVLNYGWLQSPQVPGQWPAAKLKKLFIEAGDLG